MVESPIEVEAIYEGGVLKPVRPLPLAEGTRVRLRIEILPDETTVAKDVDDPTG